MSWSPTAPDPSPLLNSSPPQKTLLKSTGGEDTKESVSPSVEPAAAVLTDSSPNVPAARTKRKRTEPLQTDGTAAATSESLQSCSTASGATPASPDGDANRVIKRPRSSTSNMVTPEGAVYESRGPSGPDSTPASAPGAASPENQTTLWIGDLERWEDEEHIFHFFDRLAPRGVLSVKIARDREQQRSLGFGFVDFASREIAERILLSAPSVKRPHGRKLKLSWAKGKTRQPFNPVVNSGGTGGGSGGGGSGAATSGSSHARLNWSGGGGGGIPFRSMETQSGGAEWYLKLTHCPKGMEAQALCDEVLRPSGYADGVSHVNTLTRGTYTEATVYFTTSDWFFAFLQQFPEGRVQSGRFSGFIEVPPDVMEKWTRLYESVTRM